MAAQDITEIIKKALENDERVKICHKYQADKALQIQLCNGYNFNVCISKLDETDYKIKRA